MEKSKDYIVALSQEIVEKIVEKYLDNH